MNYRHAFHAGGFGDVVKHAVLVRILVHLREKPAAFRVIDTHAGAGLYDLTAAEASRSPEWRRGIACLYDASLPEPARALLAPYLDVVNSLNAPGLHVSGLHVSGPHVSESPAPGSLARYPGSPAIACALLRPQDRLIACELEPSAAAALAHNLARDKRAKAIAIDGWTALNAYVPPPERRGLVLVDPAYEDGDDFARLTVGLSGAYRKWPAGTYLFWYPIKGRGPADRLVRDLRRLSIHKVLRVELYVGETPAEGPLGGCGLIIVNPPWRLDDELSIMLPVLATVLRTGSEGGHRLDWIAREN